MNILFSKSVSIIASFFLGASIMFGYTPPVQQDNLGATFDIPTPVALFETSIATAITTSATSMTLVSALDKKGTALASSTYGFILDSGKAEEEMVLADCTGTVCTNMTRGIDPVSGTTTVASLQFAHRRGASVKITDGPQLLILSRIINGIGTLPNKISYKSGTACTVGDNNQTICDKAYIDSVGSSGASNANETTKGIIELSIASEARLGTSLGSTGARLVIPNDMATSSNDVAQTHLVVTQSNGTIKNNMIDQTADYSFTGTVALATTTSIAGLQGGVNPPGTIIAYASSTPPSGYLLCDGTAKATSTYPALFSIIGYGFSTSTGNTIFSLPNLKGRQIVGYGSATTTLDAMGETGGYETHQQSVAEMPAHTHSAPISNTTSGSNATAAGTNGAASAWDTGSAGSGTAMNMMDPYIVLNYVIKY